MNQAASLNHNNRSDEIDLVELVQGLWEQKLLIALFTLVVAAGAAAYAFLTTAQYEVQSLLRPTQVKELDALNRTGVYELTPEAALKRVGGALDSYEARMTFFKENVELFKPLETPSRSAEQAFELLNQEGFKVLQPDPKKTDQLISFVGAKLTYPADVDGVKILNGFVQRAVDLERKRIAADLDGVISSRLSELERQIGVARASYEADKEARIAQLDEADVLKRADLQDELKALRQELKTLRMQRITELEEAVRIATALGIRKPSSPSALGEEGHSSSVDGNVIRTEIFNQQLPLYFMGTEALEAERDALVQRRSDDFTQPRVAQIQKELQLLESNRQIEVLKGRVNEDRFLKELAKLREEGARLKSINLDLSKLNLVRIDQPAVTPLKPIKPKKVLIIALGVVLGGMLGIFVALIRSMLIRRDARF